VHDVELFVEKGGVALTLPLDAQPRALRCLEVGEDAGYSCAKVRFMMQICSTRTRRFSARPAG
jgi:hypothetical protein